MYLEPFHRGTERRLRAWASVTAVALACFCGAPAQTSAASSALLSELIDNVEANEDLIENVDLNCRVEYSHLGEPYTTSIPGFALTLDQHEDIHHVRQDGRFRFDVADDSTSYTASKSTERRQLDRVRMFDLLKTRSLVDQTANIIEGLAPDPLVLRPHMILLSTVDYPVRLSTYLRGVLALAGAPGVRLNDGEDVEVSFLGDDVCREFECQKVSFVHTLRGTPIFGMTVWLAIDRNYLPVRKESYTYRWSKDIPIGDAEVRSFTEIEPGIWFPAEAVITCHDGATLKSERRQKPVWRRELFFEKVSLHPAYPDEYFSDLLIPDGAAVHEVVNDKIVRSYRQGTPEDAEAKPFGLAWLLWANIAVLCMIGLVAAFRRMRTRTKAKVGAANGR